MTEYGNALANNIILFVVSIAAAGMILAVLQGPFDQIAAAGANVSTTSEASQGQQFVQTYWNLLPFTVAGLGLVQLIGAAVVEGRIP